jgi:hypothetical protein
MRETSLEDFLDGSDDGDPDPDENGTGSCEGATDECNEPREHDETAGGVAEPPRPTYTWTPDDATCPDCETSAERRWWDDGRFVCADCKTW